VSRKKEKQNDRPILKNSGEEGIYYEDELIHIKGVKYKFPRYLVCQVY